MTFEEKLRQAFNAGLKCNQEHPDDDSYDQVHFERVLKLLDQNTLPPSSPTGETVTAEGILKKCIFEYYRPDFPSDQRTEEVVRMAFAIKEEKQAILKAMTEYASLKEQEALRQAIQVAESISFNTEDQAGNKFVAVDMDELREKLK